MGGVGFVSSRSYGFPFVAYTDSQYGHLAQSHSPKFQDPTWFVPELLLNQLLIAMFCVGLFCSTHRLIAVRTLNLHLPHIFKLTFAISVCLAIHFDGHKLYEWIALLLDPEFDPADVGMSPPWPMWQTIIVYFNLFVLSLAVAGWVASICRLSQLLTTKTSDNKVIDPKSLSRGS